jgi:hypothetical protein
MKKAVKRSFFAFLILLLIVQIPFVYRRFKTAQLAKQIIADNEQRGLPANSGFREFKGIIHAHTSLGGHSTGSFDELIAAANENDLDFVVMTEHYSGEYDTAALTLNGIYGKTLFVGGNEIDTADGDRFLMIPGGADAAAIKGLPTSQALEKIHSEGRVAFITYPEKFRTWDSDFDGDEVFSLHTEAKQMNPFTTLFDLAWTYPAYPDLMLARNFTRPDANLAKFDEAAAKRRISLSAGTDAHSNIGFHVFGDDAGNKLINIKLDPYKVTFRLARLHVLLDAGTPLTRESLLAVLKRGRYFIGFDTIGDSTGFIFEAGNAQMGDEVQLGTGSMELRVAAPMDCRFVIFRNGEKTFESGPIREFKATVYETGTYRVEAYRDGLGPPFDKMPWILSNPIYVR